METGLIEAITIGLLTAIWRYVDGSDNRPKGSNLIGWSLVWLAVAANFHWSVPVLDFHTGTVAVASLLVCYLLIRGMPGWESLPKMLVAFGVPTLALGLGLGVLQGHDFGSVAFAASGVLIALTYTVLTKLEAGGLSLPLTAEKIGRLSYGGLTFGLVLL